MNSDNFELSNSKRFLEKTKADILNMFPEYPNIINKTFYILENLHKNNFEELMFGYKNLATSLDSSTPEKLEVTLKNVLDKMYEFDKSEFILESHSDLKNITETTLYNLIKKLEKRKNLKDFDDN